MIHELYAILNWMGSEWVLVALFALSCVAFCVILERWFELGRLMRASRRFWDEQAESWFLNGEATGWKGRLEQLKLAYPCLESDTLDVLQKAESNAGATPDKVVRAYLDQRKMKLERNVGILGTIGSNAPFVGLLGTVLGIIRAFHDMAKGGLGGGFETISGGISEALVATAIGLLVAVPAVVFFNLLNKRIQLLVRRAESVSLLALSGKGD